MNIQSKNRRQMLQDVIVAAIKEFVKKEDGICISDLEFLLGHDSHLFKALFKNMKVIW